MSTATLLLPYQAYQDRAGNFGINGTELSLYLGTSTYFDGGIGEVGGDFVS